MGSGALSAFQTLQQGQGGVRLKQRFPLAIFNLAGSNRLRPCRYQLLAQSVLSLIALAHYQAKASGPPAGGGHGCNIGASVRRRTPVLKRSGYSNSWLAPFHGEDSGARQILHPPRPQ